MPTNGPGTTSTGAPSVIVCGEALIDLTPDLDRPDRFTAHPGGGPFNSAIALGRLGVPTGFCSRVSTDGFGAQLRGRLASAAVGFDQIVDTADPTTLAVVTLNDAREASYSFYVEGTADRGLTVDDLPPELPASVQVLHFGTLSLVLEPGASAYEHLMQREHGHRLLALDPNCRPVLIPDRDAYRIRLEGWVRLMDLVKVSAADLEWLYPERTPAEVAAAWQLLGAALVVVTDGGRGATGYRGPDVVTVPTPTVEVADTIGAGDTYNAGLIAWILDRDRSTRAALTELGSDELQELLRFAARCAAITCSRPGADPPWRDELMVG
ncbi:MAG: carbohydrate kinase [Ilumatobacteraceae bacterium]